MIHQATLVLTRRRDGEWEGVITSTRSPAEVFHGLEPLISGIRDLANALEAYSHPEATPPLWGVTDAPDVTGDQGGTSLWPGKMSR